MPGRRGTLGSNGQWMGTGGTHPNLKISSRSGNTPSEYKATIDIEFVESFESGDEDAFEAFISEGDGSGTGSGNDIAGTYRYGFNGKENDNKVKGEGNQQDYGMRIYDPRLGRFLSEDPITEEYPELTPYQFASNTPIQATDLDGLEADFSAVHANKMEYANDDKWYHKVSKFVGNTGISLWNGGVGLAETGVNAVPGYIPGNKKLINDGVSTVKGAYNWTINTSGSQKWQDIKDVATNPHTYEDVAALLITRKLSKGIGAKTKPVTTNTTALETQKLLPNSTSKVAAAQQKLATAAKGTKGKGTFVVSETGTTVSTSQSRMIQSFKNAGFPNFKTESPGIGFTLPNGNTVRAMQPAGDAPLRASFNHRKGSPVDMNGNAVNPPRGTQNPKEYVKQRTHVNQTN